MTKFLEGLFRVAMMSLFGSAFIALGVGLVRGVCSGGVHGFASGAGLSVLIPALFVCEYVIFRVLVELFFGEQ